MPGQVVAQFAHGIDSLRVNMPAGTRAGAISLDAPFPVLPVERLGHLAAVGILDAEKDDAFGLSWLGHALASFAAGGSSQRKKMSRCRLLRRRPVTEAATQQDKYYYTTSSHQFN